MQIYTITPTYAKQKQRTMDNKKPAHRFWCPLKCHRQGKKRQTDFGEGVGERLSGRS